MSEENDVKQVSPLAISSDKGPLLWQMHGHGVSTTAPASHGHSAVTYKNCLYIYGGDVKDNKRISDIHKHSLVSGTWSKINAKGQIPEARSGQSAVVHNGHLYVFGGRDGRTYYADLYSFSFSTRVWSKVDTRGSLVKRRYRHTAVVYERKMYIFGGEFGSECCYNDLYCFDFETNTWSEVQANGDIPEPRSGHSAVMNNGKMYVFGGRNQDPHYFADIHQFDFATKTWTKVPVVGPTPPRTYNHSSFYYRNSLYVFGGYGTDGVDSGPGTGHRHSELYEFAFDTNQWFLAQTRGKKPSARLGHTISFINGSLYLYGGWDRNGYRSDLHSIHFDDVRMDFRSLLRNPKLAEIMFSVENELIPAHLAIIFARCPKLIALIEKQYKLLDSKGTFCVPAEALPLTVEITNIKKNVFNLLLEYIYSGALPIDPTQCVLLRDCAANFGLMRCCEAGAYHIKQNLNTSNVLSVLQAADDSNEEEVKTYALKFIAQNYDDVAFSDELKQLKQELLIEVLRVPTKGFKKVKKKLTKFDEIADSNISTSELKQSLLALVGNPRFADIRFIVANEIIPAHYCILHSRHPTFTRLWFESGMVESATKEVIIENISIDAWLQLLRYMYSGSVELRSLEEALDLISVSDQYLLDSLKSHCENYVTTCLTSENVLQVLEVADSCRLTQLKDLCMDLLSNNFSMLAKSEIKLAALSTDLLAQIIVSHSRTCSHTFKEP